MLKLSYIIPVYNAERYLAECRDSIYATSIDERAFEVICVNDCSPDDCQNIIEKLQTEFPTLKLVCHEKNKKLGGARNTGLKVARGKYVCFVDSDDYIKTNCMRYLLNQMEEENLDILDFDFESGEYGRKKGMVKNQFSYSMGVCSGTEYVFDHRSR